MVLVDGGERRVKAGGLGDVVVAYDGDVVGHGEALVPDGLDHAEGELVAGGQDGGRTRPGVEQDPGGLSSLVGNVLGGLTTRVIREEAKGEGSRD